MASVASAIQLVGPRRSTVLITGETGTGKELAARALHAASPRSSRPLVAVNCGALPENLLESEFFGYVRGAFTGAAQNHTGRFEQADGGTIFLDEIGDLHLDLQSKLLRVLQEREIQRLGSSETVKIDVRVIAATNHNLLQLVSQGAFREDLYYRLNVICLEMPPLRDRISDIPVLVDHFLSKICAAEDLPLKSISPEALDRLTCYGWPGNIRQLENMVERAIVLSGPRNRLNPIDFDLPAAVSSPSCIPTSSLTLPDRGLDYAQVVAAFERSILEQALRRTQGNKKAAADMLCLKRTTLSAKLRTIGADTLAS